MSSSVQGLDQSQSATHLAASANDPSSEGDFSQILLAHADAHAHGADEETAPQDRPTPNVTPELRSTVSDTVPDGVVSSLDSGTRWNRQVVTFSFGATGLPLPGSGAVSEFTEAQKSAARQIFASISSSVNLQFQEISNASGQRADIEFLNVNDLRVDGTKFGGYADYPSEEGSRVYIDTNNSNAVEGNANWSLLVHEIGHALGLKHPFDPGDARNGTTLTGVNLPDNVLYTQLSYTRPTTQTWPTTPQIFDIAALQAIYGANPNSNPGNDVYDLGQIGASRTLYDTGGVDEVRGAENVDNVIDLRQGGFSAKQILSGGVYASDLNISAYEQNARERNAALGNAYGSAIENASGGSANDVLIGNILDNRLAGNNGADTLLGNAGRDRLLGGRGGDTIFGGTGKDVIRAGAGGDTIYASRADRINGGSGRDTLQIDARSDQFRFKDLGNGTYRLIDKKANRFGNIDLEKIEFIEFRDGVFQIKGSDLVEATNTLPSLTSHDASPDFLGEHAVAPDLLNLSNADSGVIADLQRKTVTSVTADPADPDPTPIAASIVDVTGTEASDVITGNEAANVLTGLGGDDQLAGLGGRDTLAGGVGTDTLSGGMGRDTVTGGGGNDLLSGNNGADTLTGGAGNDRVLGGAGADTLVLQGSQARYSISRRDDGAYRIKDTQTGSVDIVRNVEFVRFWNGDGDKLTLRDLLV